MPENRPPKHENSFSTTVNRNAVRSECYLLYNENLPHFV
jgi:hypothetical protein